MTAGSDEPNALVGTQRDESRFEPNTRATVQEIYEGLATTSQNRWPMLSLDIGTINDRFSPLLAAGFYYKTFMKEEISRASTSAASLIENHNMATHALMTSGSVRQKQDLLPRFAACDVLSTLAITEPEAGSDVRAIQATAEPVSGGYKINAHKRYVSLADIAGIVMLSA